MLRWVSCGALVVGLATVGVLVQHARGRPAALGLERLRLNEEGKLQVDVVVRAEPAPAGGLAEIAFADGRGRESVTVVGLAAVGVRRIATATTPLACGESQEVTATVVATGAMKASSIRGARRRRC